MANCCSASITLFRDEANDFTDTEAKEITDRFTELSHCISTLSYHDENILEWEGDMRWSIEAEKLAPIALAYECSIRAIGREDGNAFVQVVCIDPSGAVIQDESIGYAL